MTRADRFREMSDEQLADFFAGLISHHRKQVLEQLTKRGIIHDVTVIEMVPLSRAAYLAYLQEEVDGE